MTWKKSITARIGRRRLLAYGGAGASALAFAVACGGGSDEKKPSSTSTNQTPGGTTATNAETPRKGGNLTMRMASPPPLDPVTNSTFTAQTVSSFTFSRLVQFKTDAKPETADAYEVVPDLAAAWEVSPDGLTYTFKLRKATFHNKAPVNGRAVEAEDVKVSVERSRNEPKNTNRNVFGTPQSPIVEKVETPDAQTVVFRLAKPFGPFLTTLATAQNLWVQPREVAAGQYDPNKDQIGSGPFVFESITKDAVTYKRNPNYFIPDRPYLDSFTYRILPGSNDELANFQAGKLDISDIPLAAKEDTLKAVPGVTVVTSKGSSLPFLAPQQRGNSPMADERVRRALSLIVDRDAFLKLNYGGEGVWQNIVPSALGSWHVRPRGSDAGRWFKYDPKEAVALLKAAGYDATNKLTFKYTYTPNAYGNAYNQQAELLASMMRDTNVLAPVVTTSDYQSEFIKPGGVYFGNYEGVFYGLQSSFMDAHDYLYNQLHSASPRNHVGVNDAQLDALINKEQVTVDRAQRLALVQEIQKYAMDKMYYAPMFAGVSYTFLTPKIRGWKFRRGYGAGTESFLDLWLAA